MKNSICILIVFLLASTTSFSQDIDYSSNKTYTNYKNEISFEVLQVVNGVYQFSYERYIWKNFTANLGVGYK